MRCSRYFEKLKKYSVLTVLSSAMTGCNSVVLQIHDPIKEEDMIVFRNALDLDTNNIEKVQLKRDLNDVAWRKNFATMKMYEIDKEFDAYWDNIDWIDVSISFGGDIAQLGLTTAATAIPVAQTTKVLSAVATAVGASKTTYKQEFMLAKTKEAIREKAGKDRLSVGKTIMARLNCKASEYPFGTLLSDLDSYRTAGTFEAALLGITGTVRNLVCRAIVRPLEAGYGDQERHTGPTSLWARSEGGVLQGRAV